MVRAFILVSVLLSLRAEAGLRFEVAFPRELRAAPLDGRLLVMLSRKKGEEPRFQIDTSLGTQQVFGIDVVGLEPGETAVLDAAAIGSPIA
jgi:hypothetical protein